jgi:hypothetical protein
MALINVGSLDDFSVEPTPAAAADPALQAIESFSMLAGTKGEPPAESMQLPQSAELRGLTLQKLRLEAGFQGFIRELFNASSDIYFLAWAFDLSGQPIEGTNSPVFFYPGALGGNGTLIPMKSEEVREFIGAGALLYPQRKITSGLAVRMQIWRSRKGERELGKTLKEVATVIQESELTQALTLVSAATGVAGATVAGVAQASVALTKVVGTVLANRGDDHIDYYEGYFPASDPWTPPDQSWHTNASEIVLGRI